jgi:hypothetical protein
MIIENQGRFTGHKPTTAHIFRFFSFIIFCDKEKQFIMFKLMKQLFRMHTNSLSNEIFFDYFFRTFITGAYSKHFYLEMSDNDNITNNFSEGLNSALKRHANGFLTTDKFLDWISIDSKKTVAEIINGKKHISNKNPKFQDFFISFKKDEQWMSVILEYIDDLGNTKRNKLISGNSSRKEMDYTNLKKTISKFHYKFLDGKINVYDSDNKYFTIDSSTVSEIEEIKYLSNLDPEYMKFFKRMRYK